jgi:hypothetical protein
MRCWLAPAAVVASLGCGVKAPPRPPAPESPAPARESPAPGAVPGTASGIPADAPPDGGVTGARDGSAP